MRAQMPADLDRPDESARPCGAYHETPEYEQYGTAE